MLIHAINYHHDSAQLFERIARQPWAMLLDSGQLLNPATGKAGSQYGRYDILVAAPFITLVTQGAITTITQNGLATTSTDDPFLLLKNLLKHYAAPKTELPFTGGAVGYFAYDLGRRLEKLPNIALDDLQLPDMMIGLYDWAVVVDHREKRSVLVSNGLNAQTHQDWPSLQALFNAPFEPINSQFKVTSAIQSNLTKVQYTTAFAKIKAYISAGDCYQVNLAQRYSTQVQGDSWVAYKKLRTLSPAPFMAYMNLPANNNAQFQVLSNSPERFIQVLDKHVETRPIKGTRPRAADAAQDAKNAFELQNSPKDQAENVMIVDLLRNDLSKSCDKVSVTQLFQLQSFANVHHLVSIVVGKLKANFTAVDVLRNSFPGGSITGAPKLRAMQIIDELEPHRRGIYCGAIGYIGFNGDMDTNIAIRTIVASQNALTFYAGGGIVAESDGEKEYAETLDKAASFIKTMQFFSKS